MPIKFDITKEFTGRFLPFNFQNELVDFFVYVKVILKFTKNIKKMIGFNYSKIITEVKKSATQRVFYVHW